MSLAPMPQRVLVDSDTAGRFLIWLPALSQFTGPDRCVGSDEVPWQLPPNGKQLSGVGSCMWWTMDFAGSGSNVHIHE